MSRIIGGMSTVTQRTGEAGPVEERGLFLRGMRLVVTYIRLHPKPFAASVTGALVFAVASLGLTVALARATDEVLQPAFENGGVAARRRHCSVRVPPSSHSWCSDASVRPGS